MLCARLKNGQKGHLSVVVIAALSRSEGSFVRLRIVKSIGHFVRDARRSMKQLNPLGIGLTLRG